MWTFNITSPARVSGLICDVFATRLRTHLILQLQHETTQWTKNVMQAGDGTTSTDADDDLWHAWASKAEQGQALKMHDAKNSRSYLHAADKWIWIIQTNFYDADWLRQFGDLFITLCILPLLWKPQRWWWKPKRWNGQRMVVERVNSRSRTFSPRRFLPSTKHSPYKTQSMLCKLQMPTF